MYCNMIHISHNIMHHTVSFLYFSLLLCFLISILSVCMETLRIGSLNINGGRDSSKRALVNEIIEQKKLNIVFLQETHPDIVNETEWSLWWKGHKIVMVQV